MRKRTEARTRALARREALRHINEFLSVASHELKTPLTSIKGNVQLVDRRLRSKEVEENISPDEVKRFLAEARELLDRVDQQISRLTRLVNLLLESTRIHGNTMDLLFELCELDTIVREAVHDARHLPPERIVNVEVPEGKPVLIMGDASRIKQVIIHYLSNAHKFSHLDRPIHILLQEEGRMARVSVRDEGQGIPPHEQKRIWERLYRVEDIAVLNGSEVGLGLGLHICRTIIEQHRGKVGVYSEPGRGSTFWFLLPLLERNLDIAL